MEALHSAVAPVDKAAIDAFHAGGADYCGPPAVAPGSVFGEGGKKGLKSGRVGPVMWRSREGGLLQADHGDQEDGDDVLWALKDHVRTQTRSSTFSASQERNIARQHNLLADMLKTLQEVSQQKSVSECMGTSSPTWELHAACIGPDEARRGTGSERHVGEAATGHKANLDLLNKSDPGRRRRSCWPSIFSLSSRRRCRVDSAQDDLQVQHAHLGST